MGNIAQHLELIIRFLVDSVERLTTSASASHSQCEEQGHCARVYLLLWRLLIRDKIHCDGLILLAVIEFHGSEVKKIRTCHFMEYICLHKQCSLRWNEINWVWIRFVCASFVFFLVLISFYFISFKTWTVTPSHLAVWIFRQKSGFWIKSSMTHAIPSVTTWQSGNNCLNMKISWNYSLFFPTCFAHWFVTIWFCECKWQENWVEIWFPAELMCTM